VSGFSQTVVVPTVAVPVVSGFTRTVISPLEKKTAQSCA